MPRYSAKQRRMRGIEGRSKRKFLRLFTNVKRSKAYHGLSRWARCLLFELLDRYTGINNGMIGLGVREAQYELGCSHGSVCKAMRELDDAGLARPTKVGSYLGKKATEWRLMFLRCDKTGDAAVDQWEQRTPFSAVTVESAKGHSQKHRVAVRSLTKAQRPKSSMNEVERRSVWEAHIDIYQGLGDQEESTEQGSPSDSELVNLEGLKASPNNFGPSDDPRLVALAATERQLNANKLKDRKQRSA
jgi:hypothetical protein